MIEKSDDQEALELLLLYRVTRTTGIPLHELAQMPDWEVKIAKAIETARYLHYYDKLRKITTGRKYAEITTSEVLILLAEYEFGL